MEQVRLIGKVESVNQGAHFCNVTIVNKDKKALNVKVEPEQLTNLLIGKAYIVNTVKTYKENKSIYTYESSNLIEDVLEFDELNELLPIFYEYAPLTPNELKQGIEFYLNKIDNKIIKLVTEELYKKYFSKFYIHAAATKFHHAYVGGLAHHTLTMLKLAAPFIEVYPYLNKDLIYSGIILHDMAKINEITGPDGEYTKEGLLIGHLVMITIEIEKVAATFDLNKTEEVLLLKHIALAHHGLLNYGSPKRPQIGEALLIWYLDTIDSKFTPLKSELENTEEGSFTNMLQVLDRMRFYKDEIK